MNFSETFKFVHSSSFSLIIIELAVILISNIIEEKTISMVGIVFELTIIDFLFMHFLNAIPGFLVVLPLANVFIFKLFPLICPESVIKSFFELSPVAAPLGIYALPDSVKHAFVIFTTMYL